MEKCKNNEHNERCECSRKTQEDIKIKYIQSKNIKQENIDRAFDIIFDEVIRLNNVERNDEN